MAGGVLKGKTMEGGSYALIHGVHLPLHNTYLYARRLEHKHMHTDVYSVGPKRRNEIPIIFLEKKPERQSLSLWLSFIPGRKVGFHFGLRVVRESLAFPGPWNHCQPQANSSSQHYAKFGIEVPNVSPTKKKLRV